MKRNWIICLFFIIVFIFTPPCWGSDLNLTPEERAWINQHHIVRVRIGNAPPFMLTHGKIQGIAIDYLTQICDRNGIQIKYIGESEVTWPEALEGIKNHEIVDMVPTAKITDARKQDMIFTNEYIFSPWVIFTRAGSDFIGSMEDLNGKTVSVEQGYVIHQLLAQDYPGIRLKVVPADVADYAERPVKDLSTGVVDAYVGNLLSTTYLIQTKGYANVKVAAPTPFGNHNQAMAIRNDWPELAGIINKTLAAMTPEEHAAIRNKWLAIRYEYGLNADVFKWVLGIAGLALLFFGVVFFWNRRLKEEVDFRKKIERMLLTREQLLNDVGIIAKIGGWEVDMSTRKAKWTRGTYDIAEIGFDMPIPDPDEYVDYYLPEYRSMVNQSIDALIEQDIPLNFEAQLMTAKGRIKWCRVMGRAVRKDGRCTKLFGTLHDITEHKQAEAALRESQERFKRALENHPDMFVIYDSDLRIRYINGACTRLTGRPESDFMGRQEQEIWPPEVYTRYMPVLEAAVKTKTLQAVETELQFADGRPNSYLRITCIPLLDTTGNVVEILGITHDLTGHKKANAKRQELEAALTQAQRMESVGRLAGGVAHDYNNALSVIIGFTELAIEAVDPDSSLRSDLDEILLAAHRATDITRQLLAFARKQTIAPKVLDLNKNVAIMLKMIQRLIGEDISLAWRPTPDLWAVKMDPSQLDQVLANLCVNARDAITGVGKITIETDMVAFDAAYCADHHGFVPGEFVMLAVSDNGCGMDEEIQDMAFEPFFTTKTPDKGTGLGLATVYGIVKQNNGFINIYSEKGIGTTIKIYLPRNQGTAVAPQREITEEIFQGRGETILIVEDDAAILKLAQQILTGLGYMVLVSGTPQKAMVSAAQHAGDLHLLVTDVIMPEMNGLELTKALQSHYPDLKCIFMSGYTANTIAHHGVLDQGVNFIQKPFSKKSLAKLVRNVLDGKGE